MVCPSVDLHDSRSDRAAVILWIFPAAYRARFLAFSSGRPETHDVCWLAADIEQLQLQADVIKSLVCISVHSVCLFLWQRFCSSFFLYFDECELPLSPVVKAFLGRVSSPASGQPIPAGSGLISSGPRFR